MNAKHAEIVIVRRRSSHEDEPSRRRLEDRLRRFHDRDDGLLSRAVDHQRHRQEHQDAHRALLQSGESRGAGEGAEGHSRGSGKGRRIRGTRIPPRRTARSPLPGTGKLRGNRPNEDAPASSPNSRRSTAPGFAAVAATAAGSGKTLSDDVGAGTVQRSSRQSRQDRRRAAARAADRSVCGAEGLWGGWAERRRGVSRSVPSARQRQGGQRRDVRCWRSAGGGRRQRRTGAKIAVERSLGARRRED